jgi:hypothetical protein
MIADLFWSPLMGPVWGAALVGGAAIALAGSLVVMLRLPFIGVAMSHAALLGAVLALLLGWPPLLGSLISCVVVAVLSVPLAERTGRDRNAAFAILFSVTMGLSLLLMRFVPGPRGEALSLLWGGILTVSWWQVAGLAGMGLLLLLLLMGLRRELKAILLDREIALALGIPVNAVLVVLLAAAGGDLRSLPRPGRGTALVCVAGQPRRGRPPALSTGREHLRRRGPVRGAVDHRRAMRLALLRSPRRGFHCPSLGALGFAGCRSGQTSAAASLGDGGWGMEGWMGGGEL